MNFKEILNLELEKTKVIAWDTHNHNLRAEITRFVNDDKLKGIMTDLEWLDAVALIVNKRQFRLGVTDCATGLTYRQDK
jgi:hypothetical protein